LALFGKFVCECFIYFFIVDPSNIGHHWKLCLQINEIKVNNIEYTAFSGETK
jgi:hypothetical protein